MHIISTLPSDGWHAIIRRVPPHHTLPPTTVRLVAWALIDLGDGDEAQLVGMIPGQRGGMAIIPVLDCECFIGYWDGFAAPDEAIAQALSVLRRHEQGDGDEGPDEGPPTPDPPSRPGRKIEIPKAFQNGWS